MKRLNPNTKRDLISDIKNNMSINSILDKTGLAKSTIYYYFKKIKGKKYENPKYNILFSEKEGEIVGIFAGDGSQYHYRPNGNYYTTIHFGDVEGYVSHVKNLYDSFFEKPWNKWKEVTKEGLTKYRLRVSNKEIFNFFSNYLEYNSKSKHNTCKLKNLVLNKQFKIGFLRGFFDTDGCLSNSSNRLRAFYYTTSENLANQMKLFLEEADISSTIWCRKRGKQNWKDIFILRIKESEVNKFLNLVKPFKSKKLGR
jgi:hypothetical protein